MANIEGLSEAPLAEADLEGALALVAEAGWNQVPADWRIFLELGRGFAMKDAHGALAATAATLPYAGGFGWISMVLVGAAWRRRGIATRLLGRCIETLRAAGLVPVLDATPAGREVYRPLGFHDGWALSRWRGNFLTQAVIQRGRTRQLEQDDWNAVLALDARAFGCARAELLEGLRARSSGFACVAPGEGRVRGYLLGRDGRSATQLGPIVAEDEDIAAALFAYAAARIGGPILLDAPDRHRGFARALAERGFSVERPYTRMALGREPFGDESRMIAIAGPELG